MSLSSPVSIRCAAWVTCLLQSFGLETTLNFGAGSDPPIRQSSTSRPKNLKRSSVMAFSQSSVARCYSVNRCATQTIVTAFSPDA